MRSSRNKREVRFPTFHSAQQELYDNRTRRDVWRCGRRFGKTTELEVIAGDEAIRPRVDRVPFQVGWFSPNYKLLSPSYKRILNFIKPLVAYSNKTDGLIELKSGAGIEFWTLNDEDAGRSRAYDLVIIDEGSLVKKGLKEIFQQSIEPTLLDRRGRAIMAGTPKGIDPDNFFYEACTNPLLGWTEKHMPTRMNPTLDAEGVANLVNEYPPLVYQQEFLAEFVDWTGAAFFSLDSMLEGDPLQAVAYPEHCDAVFATLDTAIKTKSENDGTAVTFWATNRHFGTPLLVLDYDIVQIEGALLEVWLPNVLARLEELAKACGARQGSIGVFIEDAASGQILLQQGRRRNWPVHAIDSDLTAVGKDERAISVSGYHYRGMVKITGHAYNKQVNYKGQVRNHFITQVCGFRIGVKDQEDDLLDAYTYGVAIALGDREGH